MIFSKRSLEGTILIDHRNSPGISEEEARRAGCIPVGAGQTFESATITCCHCQDVFILNPKRTRPRNHCRSCDQYVCDSPVCNAECRPFKKLVDAQQEQAFRKENGYTALNLPLTLTKV